MSSIGSGFTLSEYSSGIEEISYGNFDEQSNPLARYGISEIKKENLNDLESTIFAIAGDVDRRLNYLEDNEIKMEEIRSKMSAFEESISKIKDDLIGIIQRILDTEEAIKKLLNKSSRESYEYNEKFDEFINNTFQEQNNNCIAKSKYFPVKIYNQVDDTLKFSRNYSYSRIVLSFKSDCVWYLILTDEDDFEKVTFSLNDSKIIIKPVKIQGTNMVSIRNSTKKYYLLFERDEMKEFFEKLNSVK